MIFDNIEVLKSINNLQAFARILGYKPSALSYILYKLPNKEKYRDFVIPKKNNTKRCILVPEPKLKFLQKRLNKSLTACYNEIFKQLNHKYSLAHGFRTKHDIFTNASIHTRKKYIFNLDLKNFFSSINFGRVYGFFIKNRYFKLEPKVATIIAQIACYENILPQGSPCSPVISNFICLYLDNELVKLAKRNKCYYTRYADDITFSTNLKSFPENIAILSNKETNTYIPSLELENIIKKNNFTINYQKVSLQKNISRQLVTGLIVNNKINVKREYYKIARAMYHSLLTTGSFEIKTEKETYKGSFTQLKGILDFIYKAKKSNSDEFNYKNKKPTGFLKLYKSFLFYKLFYDLNKPLIICEGKTDIEHLKIAMKILKDKFPFFALDKENKEKYMVKFWEPPQKLKNILNIADGSSGFVEILKQQDLLLEQFEKYKSSIPLAKHPIIILTDNDSGADMLLKQAKILKNSFIEVDEESFYRYKYIYLVFIPLLKGKESAEIEDLYNEEVLANKIDDKKFSRKKEIDPNKEFGKSAFVEKVVIPNANKIDFRGFEILFQRFNKVIEEYERNKK